MKFIHVPWFGPRTFLEAHGVRDGQAWDPFEKKREWLWQVRSYKVWPLSEFRWEATWCDGSFREMVKRLRGKP